MIILGALGYEVTLNWELDDPKMGNRSISAQQIDHRSQSTQIWFGIKIGWALILGALKKKIKFSNESSVLILHRTFG